jgi:multiple sugar transport system permease protein
MTSRRTREMIEGYLYVLPWIFGFITLTAGPMVASFYLSFTHYSVIRPPRFIGLENYTRALSGQDRLFYGSLARTSLFTLYFVPLGVAVSLLLAIMLNKALIGTTIFRTLFYIPTLTPPAAIAILWTWLLNAEVGPLNYGLRQIGFDPPRWLGSREWALPSIVLIALWGSAGGARMIIFLAGLQGVPEELYDAADIDGANGWQRFWHVTMPMISPVILFNTIISTIAAFRVFTFSLIATGGGPAYSTWFYMLHLYQEAFRSFRMGYASSLSWIFFIIVISLTILQFSISRQWIFYAGQAERGGATA